MSLSDSVLVRARQRVGSTIRGYALERLLGVGGMGSVYAARTADGRTVAVKSLHPELSRGASFQARFFREAYVANSIPHPGVVRVFEHGTDADGGAFLVMELLEGDTLEALWERSQRRMPVGQVLAIAERLLAVLAAAHATGIVHRDIKPDNVFLTRAGDLKVLDFGIARLLDGSGATASGEMMGTPAFMPPEQAGGDSKTADARSDVWSVGALMFTLATGRHVHEAATQPLQLIYAATQCARSLASVAPEAPTELVAIVDRALAFERDARWASAGAMLERIHALTLDASRPTVAAPSAPPGEGAGPTLPLGRIVLGSRPPTSREGNDGE